MSQKLGHLLKLSISISKSTNVFKFKHVQDTFIKLFSGIVLSLLKMTRLSSEQNTKVVQFYLQTGSVIETKRKYRSIFGPKSTPSSRAISRRTQNFIATGTTSEKPRSGRRPIASDEKSDNI